MKDDKEKLKVFDRNGVYLPMKKIGKNNPKAEQIQADNKARTMWNQTVDRALVSGVPEEQIMEVRQKKIGQKAKASILKVGKKSGTTKKPNYDCYICIGTSDWQGVQNGFTKGR